ncbi:glycosyltransferase family 4 protein [Methylococcus sp. ANG]|uniref:glycosyltransferase family 4 protein n=1 Tax=unclassified Methylococcus TaxID=2618889 RepID=UPI001C530596|nr:glycosyltransferase family 4 protein [Methylococcus sp. Mc7]QXP84585.1 glycosyltransferase family 4 protein [Methylococcus sp. Mc7]
MPQPHLLFVVTEDWFFCLHRLSLAVAAKRAGFEVSVATRVAEHGQVIESAGLRLIPLRLSRRGRNPLTEARLVADLARLYRRERPDIVHHVAMKPVIYGSLAARLTGRRAVVNALTGLGFLFTSDRLSARLLRPLVETAFRGLLNAPICRTIVENPDDLRQLTDEGVVEPGRIRLIRGSGVDLAKFSPSPEPEGPPLVVLPARMLWDKGIGEFVEAARRLRAEGVQARFALVGQRDAENPSAIAEAQLREWERSGVVEYWGFRSDMPQVLAQCHIVCLPSYREGLPVSLLEAAACTRAIVTTDVPGCREAVRHEENGLLVPRGDPAALAAALSRLIADPALRRAMGARGRTRAEEEFSLDGVVAQTLSLYREMLAR